MNFLSNSTVLALAPHTDDAELGAGATLARLLEHDNEVHIAAFSTARESLPSGSTPDRLQKEFRDAMRVLGLTEENVYVYDFTVRKLSYSRQEVLEELVTLKKKLRPEWVLLPASTDLHQDHQVLFSEGLRAFKDVTVFGYELPWNHIAYSAQAFVGLEDRHIEKKISVLQCYRSQIEKERPYFEEEFIRGLARVRGVQINMKYAESFEVLRVAFR